MEDKLKGLVAEDQKALAAITGSSTVDHRTRIALKLNCNEYIVAQFIDLHGLETDIEIRRKHVYKKLGMGLNEFHAYLLTLEKKGFVKDLKLTELWTNAFEKKAEFEQLWICFNKKGNKQTAKERFYKVIKLINVDELLLRGKTYQDNVAHKDFDYRLGLDTYLQPDKKRWMDTSSTPTKTNNEQKRTFFTADEQ